MHWKLPSRLIQTAVWVVFLAVGCAPAVSGRASMDRVIVAAPEGAVGEALKATVKVYQETSGQAVQVETLAIDQYYERLKTCLLAGRDDYDLVYLPADLMSHWAAYDALYPLEMASSEPDILSPWRDALSWEGVLYGLPAQADIEVLWYRADLFQEASLQPPQSWQDFMKIARALDHPPERRGVALAAGISDAGADFAPYLAGFCAPDAGWQGCSRENQQQALTFYSRLVSDGVAAAEVVDFSRMDAARALKTGQAAMAILPLSYAPALLACAPDSPTCLEGRSRLMWAALPGLGHSRVAGSLSAWTVPLKAARPADGVRLAAWLSGAEGAAAWALAGGLPAHPGPAQTPEVLLQAKAPYLALLAQVKSYFPALPPMSGVEEVWDTYHGSIHAYVLHQVHASGNAGPQSMLDSIQEQVNLALRRDGRLK